MEIPYSEDRDDTRFDHISSLRVKDLRSGEVYEAKMLNYSNGGINFESNSLLQKGAKIYICMQNSPYAQSSGVLEYYTGEIMWRKYLKRSFFDYGYGIQFVSGSSNQDLDSNRARIEKDSRKHPRKSIFQNIRFDTDKGIFKGRTKNISASGVFIATEEKLEVGQSLKLNLPLKGKIAEITGQIVWLNKEGFGIKVKRKQIFMGITKKVVKKRIDSRMPYSGHIFFSTKSGLFEGELKNYSKNGLFIKTNEDLTLGEFITVALPYVEDKQIKLQGQIIWRNNKGYGVELIRKRNDSSPQILKIEAKLR